MCGIIGYIGPKDVVPVLIDGLRRLEYRGYDSAGVAVVRDGASTCGAAPASSRTSKRSSAPTRSPATTASATRAGRRTAGRPKRTRIPHRDCTGKIVVVHNGIIENYLDLKQELQRQGHKFVTETDTEIVAHLVEREMKDDGLENAVRRALLLMRGLFALVLISADDPEKIVAVRNGPPIVVGLGDGEFFVASDIPGDPQPHARRRVPRRRGDGGRHAHRRRRSPTSSAGRSPRRRSACSGIRSWRRRPATSTSCSRRSSSSRRPRARRSSAASRRTPARSSSRR